MTTASIPVNWITRDKDNQLYRLFDIHLNTLSCYGVYVIYETGGFVPTVLKVGQGNVADRFGAHRQLDALKRRTSVVCATWTSVSPLIVDGVERFLANRYQPLFGDAFPDVAEIPVTLPFAA